MECNLFIAPPTGLPDKAIFITISIPLFLFSVIGNAVVVYIVVTKRCLHLPTPILICALSLCDGVTATLGQSIMSVSAVLYKEHLNCTVHKAMGFIHLMACSTSLLILCLIARDRYLHISNGLRYNEHTNTKQAIMLSMLSGVAGMFLAGAFITDILHVQIVCVLGFAAVATLCFVYICVMSWKIVSVVKAHNNAIRKNWANNTVSDESVETSRQQQREEMRRMAVERKVNTSIFAVIIIYTVSWVPLIVLILDITVRLIRTTQVPRAISEAMVWAALMSYVNGAVNPMIYGYRSDIIGREIRKFLGFRRGFLRADNNN